ncbi:MAG: hypothetical protein M1819_003908 [Sarea resinae]|nr:MAG: hypothetical protein M1819_003908 [Sarea resinae]
MPSFYPRTLPRQMPLTPPEYLPGCAQNRCGGMQINQMQYPSHPGRGGLHEKARYDLAEQYGPSTTFNAPAPMAYHHPPPAYNGAAPPGITHPGQIYGSVGAPALPPIRTQDPSGMDITSARQQRSQEQASRSERRPKEEKAVGGVAAHLDYEMDQMADFVSEMAQGMYDLYTSRICLADIDILRSVQPGSPVPPAFRKWVSQILSSTRLPSSTILLGLYYLSTRMSMLSAGGQYKASSGQVYRMLTIALVLGSKFLDDNTFQNRSWSEVSGIAVAELNGLEMEWLLAIDWKLHLDPTEQQGLSSWRIHWDEWRQEMTSRKSQASKPAKLSPIDTNVQRVGVQSRTFSPSPSYNIPYSKLTPTHVVSERQHVQYQTPSHLDQWLYPRSSTERSPPSAPETGPNTPEYFGLPGTWSFNTAPPPYSLRSMPPSAHLAHVSSQPPSYHHTPYMGHYSNSVWNGHGAGCGCMYCARHNEPYFMTPGYGMQTVVG